MSTSAGTPPDPGNGRPPVEPARRRDLRDSTWGRILLLVALLALTLLAARTCASQDKEISSQEAVEIAKRNVDFVPCSATLCVQVRYLPQGIPIRGFWLVGLAEELGADGEPTAYENLLVDVETGAVSRP